jgi:TusA-related sulfurtransferase
MILSKISGKRQEISDKRKGWMNMAEYNITDTVDITDVNCPITFVKAKIALEELDDGDILSIRLNDGEPVNNVPKSIKEEGHKVLSLTDNGDGTFDLIVQKVGD